MGNSGSTTTTAVHSELDHRDHPHHRYGLHYHWMDQQSNISDRLQNLSPTHQTKHNAQIKVLPDLRHHELRLRATNNGSILQNGGSISGRKLSSTDPSPYSIYRSKSVSQSQAQQLTNDTAKLSHPKPLMQRSYTQLDLMQSPSLPLPPLPLNQIQKYGSEPDLRDNLINNGDSGVGGITEKSIESRLSGDSNNNNLISAKSKPTQPNNNKKKKAPPIPNVERKSLPPDVQPFHRIHPTHPAIELPTIPGQPSKYPPKKMRLFKTKAESNRKSIGNITIEPITEPDFGINRRIQRHLSVDKQTSKLSINPGFMQPKFRREKSFDLSLLTKERPEMIDQNVENLKKIPEKIRSHPKISKTVNVDRDNDRSSRTKSETEFQRELIEATRRWSMVNEGHINVLTEEPTLVKEKEMVEKMDVDRFELELEEQNEIEKLDLEENLQKKKFYFGMDQQTNGQNDDNSVDERVQTIHLEEIDKFAESLFRKARRETAGGDDMDSESDSSEAPAGSLNNFQIQTLYPKNERSLSAAAVMSTEQMIENDDENLDTIQVMLRPTLPRRQFEIPRFSPATAWRTLAHQQNDKEPTIDEQDPMTYEAIFDYRNRANGKSGAVEERIEQRIYRQREAIGTTQTPPPPPLQPMLLPLPMVDNKSGDSGISADRILPALLPPQPPPPPSTFPRERNQFGSAWTPEQDLQGEESSSDDEDNRIDQEHLKRFSVASKFGNVGNMHMFSLSLPREGHLSASQSQSVQQSFNSLQRLKSNTSVTSALSNLLHSQTDNGYREHKRQIPTLQSDNWFLSRSAPNSLDNCQFADCHLHYNEELKSLTENDRKGRTSDMLCEQQQTQSLGYFTNLKHMMYLPNECESERRLIGDQSILLSDGDRFSAEGNTSPCDRCLLRCHVQCTANPRQLSVQLPSSPPLSPPPPPPPLPISSSTSSPQLTLPPVTASTQCLDDHPYKQQREQQHHQQQHQQPYQHQQQQQQQPSQSQKINKVTRGKQQSSSNHNNNNNNNNNNHQHHHHHHHRRFKFQSTIRQIERRRLAEKLSKEAEQKEAQRLSELEAMRQVEEEFQRKRAREKASIKQQLRLYSMNGNGGSGIGGSNGNENGNGNGSGSYDFNSLPIEWHVTSSRTDPDGAVARPILCSSPASLHHCDYVDTKTPYISRLIKQKSSKFSQNQHQYRQHHRRHNSADRTHPNDHLIQSDQSTCSSSSESDLSPSPSITG